MNLKLIALTLAASQLISAGSLTSEQNSVKKSLAYAMMMQGASGAPLMNGQLMNTHENLHFPKWSPQSPLPLSDKTSKSAVKKTREFWNSLMKQRGGSASESGPTNVIYSAGGKASDSFSMATGNDAGKLAKSANSDWLSGSREMKSLENYGNEIGAPHPSDLALSEDTKKLLVQMDQFGDREWAMVADKLGVPENKLNRDLVKSDVEKFDTFCNRKLAKRGIAKRGILDSIAAPFVAAGEALTGDLDGARETMDNFSRDCPVISQVKYIDFLSRSFKNHIKIRPDRLLKRHLEIWKRPDRRRNTLLKVLSMRRKILVAFLRVNQFQKQLLVLVQ